MATPLPKAIFLEGLGGLPSRKELLIDSPRVRCVKTFAGELLATLQKQDPEIRARFHVFAAKLFTAKLWSLH